MGPRVTAENRKWWTLGAVSFGLFMLMLDNTIVNVALPSIQQSLGLELSKLEWIVTGYALTFASLLLSGGKLADRYGRRRMFVAGLAVFTLASAGCGVAPNGDVLVASRVLQGVGAALMNPATLSLITATFPPAERGAAIGIWAGVSAVALSVGPVIGGVLTEHSGWSAIFFVNVPIGILAIAVSLAVIPESRDTTVEQRLDLPGLLTSALGLFALTFALIEANAHGWTSALIAGALVASVALLGLFVLLEGTQRLPMLDLSLFRNRTFVGANLALLFTSLSMFGVFFFLSIYMQDVLGFTATAAGAAFLPQTLLVVLLAPLAGRASDRHGSRWLMTAGMTLVGVQLLCFAQLGSDATFAGLLPGLLIGGVGMACTMTPSTAAGMRSVPVNKAGVAAAVISTFRQLGGSLGIALMGALVAHRARGSRDPQAFTAGLHLALEVACVIAFAGAVLAALLVRHEPASFGGSQAAQGEV